MDTKQAHEEKESGGVAPGGGLLSRRHFARGGITGSVLLSSLASKPVLGASSVGCTVSGQMSGNLSREALTFNCRVGKGPGVWIPAVDWPPPFTKGALPSSNCTFGTVGTALGPGTVFNGWTPGGAVPMLITSFYSASSGTACAVVASTSGSPPATMLQVLNTTDTDPRFKLGRAVVCSLLNIAEQGLNYPVTYHTVIAMFNATYGGGSYVVGGVTWSQARVIAYLESLLQ